MNDPNLLPYRAPGATSAPAEEDDIAAASAPLVARAAGGVVVLAGLTVALTAVQTWSVVRLYPPYSLAPYAQLALGLPAIAVGAMLFRAREAAALAGIGLAVGLAIVSGLWMVVSFAHGLLSLFALVSPLVAVAAVVLSLVALAPCRRATRARARLEAQGLSLGL